MGARLIDVGTNTSDIEVRSQRVGTSVINSSNDEKIPMYNRNEQILASHSNLSLSRHDVELSNGSHVRTQVNGRTEMIPQLDGPISIYSRERILEDARTEQELNQRTAILQKREYPGESSDDFHSDRRTCNVRRPLRGKDITRVMEGHLTEVIIETQELLGEEDLLMMDGP